MGDPNAVTEYLQTCTSFCTMSTQELTTLRLRWDSSALAAIEQDLRDVDSRILTIEQQVADLTLSLGVARDWRADILSRRETVREHLAARQRAISPISTCPDDVLRAIFTHRAQQPDEMWPAMGDGGFNKGRAEAPFVIAAVCQSWRQVALTTPRIWDYVAVPSLKFSLARPQCLIDRTRNVVARSCATPLDILFGYVHDVELPTYTAILDLVYPHIHRWRRFEFWSTKQFPRIIPYLRGRASCLEGLCIHHDAEDDDDEVEWQSVGDPSDFVVGATRLSELRIEASSLCLDTTSLPRLSSLTLVVPSPMPSATFWAFFGSTKRLNYLALEVDNWDSLAGAIIPNTVELPMLTQLRLRKRATSILVHHPTVLSAPALAELRLEQVPVDAAFCLTQVLRSLASNSALSRCLQTLKIFETSIASADGEQIARIAQLTELYFIACTTIDAEFWVKLETAPAALTHITLITVALTTVSIDAFLCLVRRRKSSQTCSRITKVAVIGGCNFSRRDRAELTQEAKPVSSNI